MKKTKKLLSLLTALTMTASAFAGLAIPVNAEDTTLYTMDVSTMTAGDVTKKSAATGAQNASEIAKYNIDDFGTGSTTAGVDATPALDGWGYMHYGFTDDLKDGRQSAAHVAPTENAFYVQGVGNNGCNAAISFIPANVDGLTMPTTGYVIYSFKSIVTSTADGGNGKGSLAVGFTSGTGGSVTDAASLSIAASGTKDAAINNDIVFVNNVATGEYKMYQNGLLAKEGTAAGITGIYAQTTAKYIKNGVANLVVTSTDTAPAAVEYSFVGDSNAELTKGTALVGAVLTAPEPPSVSGKTFKEWQDADGTAVTEFVVGSTNTVYTAVYESAPIGDVTFATNAYAKITLKQEGKNDVTIYTGADGAATIQGVDSGTCTYTIEKTGYTSKTDTITVETGEETKVEAKLSIAAIEGHDYFYYEANFAGYAGKAGFAAAGDRGAEVALEPIELPEISTIAVDFDIEKAEEGQITWQLLNDSNKVVVGIQMVTNDGIYAFTGWSGNSGLNQSGDVGLYTEGKKIADAYVGKTTVEFVIDQNTNAITAKCNGTSQSLTLLEDASKIKTIKAGKYRDKTTAFVTGVRAERPDPNEVFVTGDAQFAKIAGKVVTRDYKATPGVIVPGETFTWSVTDASGAEVTGVTIDQNGVLSVADTATPGKVIVKAVSDKSADKKGEIEVNVEDYATLIPTVEHPLVMEPNTTHQFTVTKIVDEYGDDVTEYFTPEWLIDDAPSLDTDLTFNTADKNGKAVVISAVKDENGVLKSISTQDITISGAETKVTAEGGAKVYLWDSLEGMVPLAEPQDATEVTIGEDVVAAIGAQSGTIKTYAEGDVTVKLTLVDGQDPEEYRIDIATYSKVVDYEAGMTEVDITDLVEDADITAYRVTLASEDGAKLAQEDVQAVDGKVALPALIVDVVPAKVEVAPVFSVTSGIAAADERYIFNVPADTYDITITMSGQRADLYVNKQLVVNNMLQYASRPPYTDVMHDVVVSEGYAIMNTTDYSNGKYATDSPISLLQIVKSPSIVTRTPKIYVMGDSLVAKYYEDADTMTGWGQVLQDYIADDMEVVNIANSGADSIGIADTQLTRILGSAQPGDYMVLESGYNDKGHNIGQEVLKERVTYMTNAARAKGVKVVLVSPNASAHDYGSNVAWTSTMTEVATALKADYINLAELSYNWLNTKYGSDFTSNDDLKKKYNIVRSGENYLHSTVNAANCWAAIVASELGKLGVKTTDHEYTFNDGTNDITVSVATMTATN